MDNSSVYARYFDEKSPQWSADPIRNLTFLTGVEKMVNDMFKEKSVLFLNEVYEMLGLERSVIGHFVGWILNNPDGDNFIDFGIRKSGNERFVNGTKNFCLLNFNVDGVVLDRAFSRIN